MTTLAKYLSFFFLSPPDSVPLTGPPAGNNEGLLLSLPPLEKGVPNTVLVYYGSFNPPHVGHMCMLQAVLENTTDWHVVGVLVWCMADRWLLTKPLQGGPLVLSQQQRAALWRSDPRVPQNVWVVDEALFVTDELGVIWDGVAEAAEWDGFEIQWVDIMGPDRYIRGRWEGVRQPVHKRGLVVCDATRACEFLDDAGVPRQGKADSQWTKIHVTARGEAMREREFNTTCVVESAESPGTASKGLGELVSPTPPSSSNSKCDNDSRMKSGAKSSTATTPSKSGTFSISKPIGETPTVSTADCPPNRSAVANSMSVWECYNIKHPECRTRLICKTGRQRANGPKSPAELTSSTHIRELVESSDGNRKQEGWDALVLSPELFRQFVREYKKDPLATKSRSYANQDENLEDERGDSYGGSVHYHGGKEYEDDHGDDYDDDKDNDGG